MKVLLINGSPNQYGCTYTALKEVASTLEKHNINTEIFYLVNRPFLAAQLVHTVKQILNAVLMIK